MSNYPRPSDPEELLSTKFTVPFLRTSIVTRDSLLARMDDGYKAKLTLISAPAGFGKTTLVSQWITSRCERYQFPPAAWITIALAAIVVLVILGIGLGRVQIASIIQATAAEGGPLSSSLRLRLKDPVLWASLWIRTAISFGIVFLMTVKPGLMGALIFMGVAILLGLAFSLPNWGRDREKVQAKQAGDSL